MEHASTQSTLSNACVKEGTAGKYVSKVEVEINILTLKFHPKSNFHLSMPSKSSFLTPVSNINS